MAEIDRLSVALDLDGSAYSRGLKKAVGESKGFASELGKIGTSADTAAKRGEAAMSRLSRAIRGAANEARKPINLKVAVDTSQISGAFREISNLRNEVSRDAVMRVGVDTSAISGARAEVQGLRQDISQVSEMRLSVDTSQLNVASSQISAVKQNASSDTTMRIIADMSGIQGMTDQIQYVKSEADQGGMFTVRTDFDGSDAEIGMNAMRAQASTGTTMKIVADADVAAAMTKLAALDGQIAGTNGRRITVYGNVDQSISQAIPAALGDLNTRLQQSQTAMAIFASFSTVVTDAMGAGIATAAVGAAGALGSFAIVLGEGLIGAAGAAGSAMITAGVAVQGIGQFAAGAISNTLGLGKGMFDLAGATKAAGKEVKAFETLVAAMPAGTEAASNAQQRLALAQQYQAGITQLQISWWGKFGGAANTLAASLNTLRLGFYEIGSVAGGMMIPTITEFVNIATSQLPYVALAAGMMVRAFNEGTIGLRAFLESAQGTSALVSIWEGIGRAAEPAMTIISQGLIVMLQGFTPAIQYGTQLLEVLANLSVQAGNWAKGAEGTATIEAAWASMVGTAQQLWEVVSNLGEGFVGLGVALAGTGLGEEMLTGLVNLSAQFRDLMSASGEGRQAVTDFMESVRPALEAIVPAAMQWGEAFFHVIDSVVGLKNEATGLSVLEEIITSLGNAAGPFAEMFIHTFETIGPLLPPLIDELAEFFTFFGTATPQMEAFLGVGTTLLGWFNDLSPASKTAAANLFAAYAVFSSFSGLDIGTLATSVGGFVSHLLLMRQLTGISTTLNAMAVSQGAVGASAAAATPSLWGFLAPALAIAALGAIVIDIVVHLPEMAEAFSTAWAEARAGGEGYSRSFVEGFNSAIDQTTILSWVGALGDAIDSALTSVTPVSLWDVLIGDATLDQWAEESGIGAQIIGFADWIDSSLREITPVSLWDVLIGDATFAEWAEGSGIGGQIMGWWEGVKASATDEEGLSWLWTNTEYSSTLESVGGAISEWWAGLKESATDDQGLSWLWSDTEYDFSGTESSIKSWWDDFKTRATDDKGLSWLWSSGDEETGEMDPELEKQLAGVIEDVRAWWDENKDQLPTVAEILGFGGGGGEEGGGSFFDSILEDLNEAWGGIQEWMGGLDPEFSLMDSILGVIPGADLLSSFLPSLDEMWAGVQEWMSGVGGEEGFSLMDTILGIIPGGTLLESFLPSLDEMWAGVQEWMSGIGEEESEFSLMDTILGIIPGGTLLESLLPSLDEMWAGVQEWMSGIGEEESEFSLMDSILGIIPGATLLESFLPSLDEMWAGVTEWLGGLVPDITLVDILMGLGFEEDTATQITEGLDAIWEHVTAIFEGIKEDTSRFFSSLYNDYWLYYLGSDGVIATAVGEFFSVLYNDYWLYYLGSDGVIATAVSDFFSVLYNDYWLYYLGSDGVIMTAVGEFFSVLYNDWWLYYLGSDGVIITTLGEFFSVLYNDWWLYYLGTDGLIITTISEFFTMLYNDWWLYYLGTDGLIITTISEFFSVLYNDWWLYYLGTDGVIMTAISEFFTMLYNDWWLYYLGSDGTLVTEISNFFSVIYNDYWLYYMGTDGVIMSTISDFFTTIYNDYWLYYLGSDGVIVTAVSDAWTAITTGVDGFVEAFKQKLSDGIKAGVDAALGWLRTLLQGVSSVLGAIGATSTQSAVDAAAAALPVSGARHGLGTDEMARGGRRGGQGTPGADPRVIVWNEQNNGREWWIATGDPNKNRQKQLLAGAAEDLGMGVTPMASGGVMSGSPIYMQDGGFTHLGIGGLGERAGGIAGEIASQFGVYPNTYSEGPLGPHGSLHGNVPENTFDFWGPGGPGDPLDLATGDAIMAYLKENYGSELDTVIWQGVGEGPGGAFEDGEHFDHLHASIGGGGIMGTAGALAQRLMGIAKSAWDAVIASLPTPSFGEGPLWDGVEEFVGTLPEQAWNWILSKIPRGRGGGGSAGLTGDIMQMAQQGIEWAGWPASELQALDELWGQRESGWDPNIVNPESGAYGIPQILPSAHPDAPPVGDAAGQIEWGINYISERYGTPTDALNFWLENGWYARGGSTDDMQAGGVVGAGGRLSALGRTRERYQPAYEAREFPDETTSTTSRASTATSSAASTTGTTEKKIPRRRRKRMRRRERRQGTTATGTTLSGSTTSTGGTGTTGTLSESISRTSGTSGSATAMPSAAPGGTGMGATGTGGRRQVASSQPISQSINATGSGEFTDVQDTEQAQGRGARIRVRPRSTFKARQSVNQTTSTSGARMRGAGGRSGGRKRRRGAGSTGGSGYRTRGGQYGGYGTGTGTSFANVQMSSNRRNRRRRMAEGGYIDSIGVYHNGGSIPGLGEQLIAAEAGERVLSQSQNRTFEALVDGIQRWSPGVTQSASSSFGRNDVEEKLDKLIETVEHGNRTATPVKIDNTGDVQRLVVNAFIAGLESDTAADILDPKMAESLRFASTLGGR